MCLVPKTDCSTDDVMQETRLVQGSTLLFKRALPKFTVVVALQNGSWYDMQDQKEDTTGPEDAVHSRGRGEKKWKMKMVLVAK